MAVGIVAIESKPYYKEVIGVCPGLHQLPTFEVKHFRQSFKNGCLDVKFGAIQA